MLIKYECLICKESMEINEPYSKLGIAFDKEWNKEHRHFKAGILYIIRKGVRKMKVFDFLNGKKTLFGAVIFFVAVQLRVNGMVDEPTLAQLNGYVEFIATLLTLVGLGHKVVKTDRVRGILR